MVGATLQSYLIFLVARDLITTIYFFILGDFLGFWKAISLHLISLPIDCFFLLIFGIWGAV